MADHQIGPAFTGKIEYLHCPGAAHLDTYSRVLGGKGARKRTNDPRVPSSAGSHDAQDSRGARLLGRRGYRAGEQGQNGAKCSNGRHVH